MSHWNKKDRHLLVILEIQTSVRDARSSEHMEKEENRKKARSTMLVGRRTRGEFWGNN